jgi:hypothetical protein
MHDLVDQLTPISGEFVIDKPGKGNDILVSFRFVDD